MTPTVVPFTLALSALLSLSASAENLSPTSPYYGGLSLGLFSINDSSTATTATLVNALGGSANANQDTSGYMGRIFGGMHINQTSSFELGYIQSSPLTQRISGVNGSGAAYAASITLNLMGWDYSVLVRPHRALNHAGPFLRLGGHYLTVAGNVNLTVPSTIAKTSSYSGSGFIWGFGYDMPIKESLDLRVEYLGFKNIAGQDSATDNFCINVVKRF